MSEYRLAPWAKTALVIILVSVIAGAPAWVLDNGDKGDDWVYIIGSAVLSVGLFVISWSGRAGRYADLLLLMFVGIPLIAAQVWGEYSGWERQGLLLMKVGIALLVIPLAIWQLRRHRATAGAR